MRIVFLFLLFFSYVKANANNNSIIQSQVDPFVDNNLTCEEFEKYADTIFIGGIDLGSGNQSPISVNYYCPKSIASLEFMRNLLNQADHLRSPNKLHSFCTGSSIHANWRYFRFGLAKLGYHPQAFKIDVNQVTKQTQYFREWSYKSPYNRKLYEDYLAELKKVKPLLSRWYLSHHNISKAVADNYSNNALNYISHWGFGYIPYSWEPETILLPKIELAIANQGKEIEKEMLLSLSESSENAKFNSLNLLLVENKKLSVLKKIFQSINRDFISENDWHKLLSNSLRNEKFLYYLLDKNVNPNSKNDFGKTALYYAIQLNFYSATKILLENGANVNHQYSIKKINEKYSCAPLTKSGRTPLMHGAQHSDVKMLELLLKYGANINDKDVFGSNALDYAKEHKKAENLDFLIKSDKK